MNLYLIERTDRYNYGEYDSFVAVAQNEIIASKMSPELDENGEPDKIGWTSSENVKVTLLGVSIVKSSKIICTSYNGGS